MNFDEEPLNEMITSWIQDLSKLRKDEFRSYDNLEAYVRNHLLNETTKFFSCNKKQLETIFNQNKKDNLNV